MSDLRSSGAATAEPSLDWGPLRAAAEAAKVRLSEQEETPVRLREGPGLTASVKGAAVRARPCGWRRSA